MQAVYICPDCEGEVELELLPDYLNVDASTDDAYVYWQCPKCNEMYGATFTKPSYRELYKCR